MQKLPSEGRRVLELWWSRFGWGFRPAKRPVPPRASLAFPALLNSNCPVERMSWLGPRIAGYVRPARERGLRAARMARIPRRRGSDQGTLRVGWTRCRERTGRPGGSPCREHRQDPRMREDRIFRDEGLNRQVWRGGFVRSQGRGMTEQEERHCGRGKDNSN